MPFLFPSNRRARLAESDFDQIFVEHWERIYQVLFRLTGEPADAEDLALETFYRLWQQPPASDVNLGGWLYRVACNLGYNALRSTRRRRDHELHAGRDALDLPGAADPQREIESLQERQRVRSTLKRLHPRSAHALVLRHAGLSYREIAAALDVNPASVGNLLLRAEQQFERLYQGDE